MFGLFMRILFNRLMVPEKGEDLLQQVFCCVRNIYALEIGQPFFKIGYYNYTLCYPIENVWKFGQS